MLLVTILFEITLLVTGTEIYALSNMTTRSEAEIKRTLAINRLFSESQEWGQNYILADFILDKALREILGLPHKTLGKPPYEWIENYN